MKNIMRKVVLAILAGIAIMTLQTKVAEIPLSSPTLKEMDESTTTIENANKTIEIVKSYLSAKPKTTATDEQPASETEPDHIPENDPEPTPEMAPEPTPEPEPTPAETEPEPTPEPRDVEPETETATLAPVVETMAAPAPITHTSPVVYVVSDQGNTQLNTGSGCVISGDGLILTNYHVCDGTGAVSIIVDGIQYPAQILGYNVANDVCLLKAELNEDKLTPFAIGDSSAIHVGENVTAKGLPKNQTITSAGTVQKTGVSANVPLANGATTCHGDLIETNAYTTQGCSGGALVNEAGELIGINVLIRTYPDEASLAIPINTAINIANEILENQ